MTDIERIIDTVCATGHSHVIVFFQGGEDGVRLRCESKAACEAMAKILGPDARVIPRRRFLRGLRRIEKEG